MASPTGRKDINSNIPPPSSPKPKEENKTPASQKAQEVLGQSGQSNVKALKEQIGNNIPMGRPMLQGQASAPQIRPLPAPAIPMPTDLPPLLPLMAKSGQARRAPLPPPQISQNPIETSKTRAPAPLPAPQSKKLTFHPITERRPELYVNSNRWGKNQTPLADKYHTDQFWIDHPSVFKCKNIPPECRFRNDSSLLIVDIPKEGSIFRHLNELTKKHIDPQGFKLFTNKILCITKDLNENFFDNSYEQSTKDLQAEVQILLTHCKTPESRNVLLHCQALLDYVLVVLDEMKQEIQDNYLGFFNNILKETEMLPPCAINAESIPLIFTFNGMEIPFDKENVLKHILSLEDHPGNYIDCRNMTEKSFDLLTSYLQEGNLKQEVLGQSGERVLLEFFDLAVSLNIPRLEALIAKEIIQRLMDGAWIDSHLIEQRKQINDALAPAFRRMW